MPQESISPDRKVRRFVGTVPANNGQVMMDTEGNENEFMLISAIKKPNVDHIAAQSNNHQFLGGLPG